MHANLPVNRSPNPLRDCRDRFVQIKSQEQTKVLSSFAVRGESLAAISLFSDLDLTAREEIAGKCTSHEVAARATILQCGDTSHTVYFILSGMVEATIMSAGGKLVSYCDRGPGDVVGELAAIDGQARCANVTATTNCRLVSMGAADLAMLIARYPSVAQKMLRRMSSQVRELSGRLFDVSALLVPHRIRAELLRLARHAPGSGNRREIRPAPTHAHIASRATTHREAVAREFSQLVKEGLLQKVRAALVVTDLARLEHCVLQSREAF